MPSSDEALITYLCVATRKLCRLVTRYGADL
jgi:hypothetical protein